MAVAVVVKGQTVILEESVVRRELGAAPDRKTLVRELRQDLRKGVSPYLRLHRAHAALCLAARGAAQLEELRFVEGLFGVLLGASNGDAEARLSGLDAAS